MWTGAERRRSPTVEGVRLNSRGYGQLQLRSNESFRTFCVCGESNWGIPSKTMLGAISRFDVGWVWGACQFMQAGFCEVFG